MAAPQYTADDFAAALQALLPRGFVWPREPSSVQSKVALGLAKSLERGSNRAVDLLIDAFPATAIELLTEWEQTLGLPDLCGAGATTISDRQAQVLAKLIGPGGQSLTYMVTLAAALGFTITITQFTMHDVNSDVDTALNSTPWAYAWQVNAPLGAEVLQCIFERIKPAHTVVIFNFT